MSDPRPTDLAGVFAASLAQVRRRTEQSGRLADTLRTVSGRATSDSRMVTVVVGSQGEVTDITFATRGYRSMAPAELSAVLLTTIARAREAALSGARQAMAGMSVAGIPFDELLSGKADWTSLLPDGVDTDRAAQALARLRSAATPAPDRTDPGPERTP